MLTTDQRGAVAELAIAHLAAQLGAGVFKPLTDGERYDLIFDLRPRLVRVQCKTAVLSGSVLKVPCYSSRRCREGFIKRFYDSTEVDAIAAYSPDPDRCYFLPLPEIPGRSYVQLRLHPCVNNQRERINWAASFLLADRLKALLGP